MRYREGTPRAAWTDVGPVTEAIATRNSSTGEVVVSIPLGVPNRYFDMALTREDAERMVLLLQRGLKE